MQRCRCGSRRVYKRCCQPWHQGAVPPTPEELMRSRYTAYVLGDVDYIMKTTAAISPHREQDSEAWRLSIQAFCEGVRFVSLTVLDADYPGGDVAYVRFRVDLRQGLKKVGFEEHSRFVKLDGVWFYDRGV